MSVFIDTGNFVAFANRKDQLHERAFELMDEARRGVHGIAYTSDYVLDEIVTTILARTRRLALAINAGTLIIGSKEKEIPAVPRLLRVDEKTFQEAWNMFRSGKTPDLSFTDQTIVSHARAFAGGTVMSFDKHFDGILSRIF